eukprot:gene16584-19702_t
MKSHFPAAQLFLRLALGISFILPVLDRVGLLGLPGSPNVSWGNWQNFVAYTNTLLPFLNSSMASIMGAIASIAELLFGLLLIIGYKTRLAAFGSFLLTLTFALCMMIFTGYRQPFSYSVYTASAASLLFDMGPVENIHILTMLGGAYAFSFAVFHTLFWHLFKWKSELKKLSYANRAIMQILNLRLIYVISLSSVYRYSGLAEPLNNSFF